MTGRCEEFGRSLERGIAEGKEQTLWREHLAGCAVCRQQAAADAVLRETVAPPPPELADGFEGRLRRRLEGRLAEEPAAVRRPGRLRPAALWTLAVYGTAASLASVLVLSRLPWQSIAAPPALGITLVTLALLSPLVLVDRVGIVRPPG